MSIQPKGRIQAYSAGNKTYGFGRSNATSGPVDKLGYRERDAKPMTSPNYADILRNSPLGNTPAARTYFNQSALQRRMTDAAPAPIQQHGAAVSPTGAVSNFVNAPQIQAPPMGGTTTAQPTPGAETGGMVAAPGVHAPPMGGTTTQAPGGPNSENFGAPSGYVNPAGPPGMQGGGIPIQQPQRTLADLPNDPAYQAHLAQINSAAARHHAQFGQQQHDIEGNSFQAQRQIEEQAPKLYENATNNFAARGLAYSGRHELDQGEIHNQVAGQLNDVQQQKTNSLNQLQNNDLDFRDQQQGELSAAQQEFIRSLAPRAGQLGLDHQTQDTSVPDYAAQLQQLLANYGKGPAGQGLVKTGLVSPGLGVGGGKINPATGLPKSPVTKPGVKPPITGGPKTPVPPKRAPLPSPGKAIPSPVSSAKPSPVSKAPVRRVPSNLGRRK